jgi:hypothetical protein
MSTSGGRGNSSEGRVAVIAAAIIGAIALLIVHDKLPWPLFGSAPQSQKLPRAYIHSLWVEHNTYDGAAKGMRIHLKFGVSNLAGVPCRATAYFFYAAGNDLKDTNGSYVTVDGQVASGANFTANDQVFIEPDMAIFMPYSEFDLSNGEYDLMFRVYLYDKSTDTHFVRSDNHYFTYSAD